MRLPFIHRTKELSSLSYCVRHWLRNSLHRVFYCAAIVLFGLQFAGSQAPTPGAARPLPTDRNNGRAACDLEASDPARAALRLICQRDTVSPTDLLSRRTVVVGFVGGFASPNDLNHPEVLFAAYLRDRYGSDLEARVFSNHDQKRALEYVLGIIDTNHDGILSAEEKTRARVILFGHSWGASQAAAFARSLQRYSVPVLLTVQIDIVSKYRQQPSLVSSNVENAVNFFQSEGLLRGRSEIEAADGGRTKVIGNFRYTYRDKPINCNNYPWFARTFNKPHHEIENDPAVWNRIASLIDTEVSSTSISTSPTEVSEPSDPSAGQSLPPQYVPSFESGVSGSPSRAPVQIGETQAAHAGKAAQE